MKRKLKNFNVTHVDRLDYIQIESYFNKLTQLYGNQDQLKYKQQIIKNLNVSQEITIDCEAGNRKCAIFSRKTLCFTRFW